MKKLQTVIFISFCFMILTTVSHAKDTRSFYMGFTPQPYDLNEESYLKTYKIINKNADIISHHIDEGVPWGITSLEKYSQNMLEDIARRKLQTNEKNKVFLSLSPLNYDRKSLAGFWGNESHEQISAPFHQQNFSDPKVIQSYILYAEFMINSFKPDYFAYAIEVEQIALSKEFYIFCKEVYGHLKKQYPHLPIFITFAVTEKAPSPLFTDAVSTLSEYSDFYAVSIYPYTWDGVGGDPSLLSDNWLEIYRDLEPEKPFIISETGFLAEPFWYLSNLIYISGSESNQKVYLEKLLKTADYLNAEFVIWFVPIDYDALWEKMKAAGISHWFSIWRNTGLFDENLEPRSGFKVWKNYLEKKHSSKTK